MNNYSFTADFLNKFSQLTPWVQVALGGFICAMFGSWGYFLKEIVKAIFMRRGIPAIAPSPPYSPF